MSWYKVTLITQNLTGGVTHYTSCYTAEIAQITRKNTRFMAYLIAFHGQKKLFFTRLKKNVFSGLFQPVQSFYKAKKSVIRDLILTNL